MKIVNEKKQIIGFFIVLFCFTNMYNAISQNDSIVDIPIIPQPPLIPDYDAKLYPLEISKDDSIFNYNGTVYCNALIDTLERKIVFVTINRLRLSNENDTVEIVFGNNEMVTEYPKLAQLIYPYIFDYVRGIPLINNSHRSYFSNRRFYYYVIPIHVK
jgi:hypothetical protein